MGPKKRIGRYSIERLTKEQSTQLDTLHNKFRSSSPAYKPTREETYWLWNVYQWRNIAPALTLQEFRRKITMMNRTSALKDAEVSQHAQILNQTFKHFIKFCITNMELCSKT